MRFAPLTLWLLAGCVAHDSIVRVERGPLLRTSERQAVLEGGATADVRVEGTWLKLTVAGYDVCRTQSVEEYTEELINDSSNRAFGPALSTGMVGTVAGAVLLLTSAFVSNAPSVEANGAPGFSTRQYMQLAGGLSLGVGVPALVVALITRFSGEAPDKTRRVEEVSDQHDVRCNERPVHGTLALVADDGAAFTFPVVEGAVDVDSEKMPFVPQAMHFDGRPVELSDEGRELFSSWASQAAQRLDPTLPKAPPPRAEIELPMLKTFEEAVEKYVPSTDLSMLGDPEANTGRAVLLQGVVNGGVSENIGTVQVGEREVFLFIPPARTWQEAFPPGTRVEAVAVVAGTQTLGEKTLPLLRAVFMRTAW